MHLLFCFPIPPLLEPRMGVSVLYQVGKKVTIYPIKFFHELIVVILLIV